MYDDRIMDDAAASSAVSEFDCSNHQCGEDKMKEDWWIKPLIVGLLMCPIVGIAMWVVTYNAWWLWMILPLVLFLS